MIWTEDDEKLVKDYIKAEGINKERLALKLRPKLNQQSQIMLSNYFVGWFRMCDFNNNIKEGATEALLSLDKYDPNMGRSFSWIQRNIKLYFWHKNDDKRKWDRNDKYLTISEPIEKPKQFDIVEEEQLVTGSTIHYLKSIPTKKTNKNVLATILSMLTDSVERSYERFVIELFERSSNGIKPVNFRKKLNAMGFAFHRLEAILNNEYKDTVIGREYKDDTHFWYI